MADSIQTSKELPQSIEAEVSVLGAVLLDPDVIDEVASLIGPDDFVRPAHCAVFEAVRNLHERNDGIDLVPVMEELKRMGKLDDAGGAEYLAYLVDAVPTSANAVPYATIVQEKSQQRALIKFCSDTLRKAYAGKERTREMLDEAQAGMFRIAEAGLTKGMVEMGDVLKEAFERIEQAGDAINGLRTDFHDLDELTSGLQSGELIVCAGRPSMGKTTLALNIVERVTTRQEKVAAVFSLEMSAENIARNMLCMHAKVNPHKLRSGMLSAEELPRLSLAVGELSEAKIFIDDTPGLTAYEIRAKSRMLKARRGLDIVVVDYLQLMNAPGIDSREQQISAISRSLKGLARELDVPVIAISQLNRGPENRETHRPRMSDLRESGAIEQDADVILLIHRPSQYKWEDERDMSDEDLLAEIQVAKQRNGPTGVVKLSFLRHIMRFEDAVLDPHMSGGGGGPI